MVSGLPFTFGVRERSGRDRMTLGLAGTDGWSPVGQGLGVRPAGTPAQVSVRSPAGRRTAEGPRRRGKTGPAQRGEGGEGKGRREGAGQQPDGRGASR